MTVRLNVFLFRMAVDGRGPHRLLCAYFAIRLWRESRRCARATREHALMRAVLCAHAQKEHAMTAEQASRWVATRYESFLGDVR